MPTTVQAIVITPDIDRLRGFYAGILGAIEESRVPDEGPVFFLGLRIGDSQLGLVADSEAPAGSARETGQRILISVDVENVDATLERVEPHGGRSLGPPNDMPWGQRVAHLEDPDGNRVNLTQAI